MGYKLKSSKSYKAETGFHNGEFEKQQSLLKKKLFISLHKKVNNPLVPREILKEIKEYIKKEKDIFHKLY